MFYLLLPALAFSVLASPITGAEPPASWYVQVVRGTDHGTPPEKTAKRIGPKLGGSLSRVFKWQHFYEVKQVEVPVTPGKMARVPVGPDRELHIHFTSGQSHDAELRLYRKGKLVRKDTAHLKNRMAILGGDEREDGWFVVVRRDKPTSD